MIVIKDSLRSATPHREAWGMYPLVYTFFLYHSKAVRFRVDKLPTPTDSEIFACSHSIYCYQSRKGVGEIFWRG